MFNVKISLSQSKQEIQTELLKLGESGDRSVVRCGCRGRPAPQIPSPVDTLVSYPFLKWDLTKGIHFLFKCSNVIYQIADHRFMPV